MAEQSPGGWSAARSRAVADPAGQRRAIRIPRSAGWHQGSVRCRQAVARRGRRRPRRVFCRAVSRGGRPAAGLAFSAASPPACSALRHRSTLLAWQPSRRAISCSDSSWSRSATTRCRRASARRWVNRTVAWRHLLSRGLHDIALLMRKSIVEAGGRGGHGRRDRGDRRRRTPRAGVRVAQLTRCGGKSAPGRHLLTRFPVPRGSPRDVCGTKTKIGRNAHTTRPSRPAAQSPLSYPPGLTLPAQSACHQPHRHSCVWSDGTPRNRLPESRPTVNDAGLTRRVSLEPIGRV